MSGDQRLPDRMSCGPAGGRGRGPGRGGWEGLGLGDVLARSSARYLVLSSKSPAKSGTINKTASAAGGDHIRSMQHQQHQHPAKDEGLGMGLRYEHEAMQFVCICCVHDVCPSVRPFVQPAGRLSIGPWLSSLVSAARSIQ